MQFYNPFRKHDPNILEATGTERREAIDRLIEQGTFESGYYLLLLLATLIVTPGLLLNNVAVIIGGMILAPLLIPLLSISLSLVSGNVSGFYRSVKILVVSIIITLATSALLTIVLTEVGIAVNWIPEKIDTGLYIFIAFCSGVAGSFAWVKENLSSSVAGVAVAVSLLPPLCAAGVGMAHQNMMLTQNSLILFTANLIGICLAGFLVFWILGFINTGEYEEKAIKKAKD